FFFQAEGGIRDGHVTGVQTCALPISHRLDVKIESMSKRGDSGVARVQGLVIFVAGTKVGDSVKIKITKVGRGYATAEVAGQVEAGKTEEAPAAEPEGNMESETGEEETKE